MAKKLTPITTEPYHYAKPKPYFFFKVGKIFYERLAPVPYVYVMPDLKRFIKNLN